MSDPVRIRRGTKKEFSRVSGLLDGKINEAEKRLKTLEDRFAKLEGQIAKLEADKSRKRKKTAEKTE